MQRTYAQLADDARRLAATLQAEADGAHVAILAARSATAYAGLLGAMLAGRAYVPVGPQLPVLRARWILEDTAAPAVIVDPDGEALLPDLLQQLSGEPRTWILPHLGAEAVAQLTERWPGQRFVGADGLAEPGQHQPVAPGRHAYVLFTSGSTGRPKGVAVRHDNVGAFLDAAIARYAPRPGDRFSQLFELGFDLSVFDLFVAWSAGACVCVPSASDRVNPGQWIGDAGLSVWFSVPSLAEHMRRLRMLQPGAFPGLRLSLFCGEALPMDLAEAWRLAAPGAPVDNLYGPTELTIACTWHRHVPGERGELVPIGGPLPGATIRLRHDGHDVEAGQPGTLWVAGPQVTDGYLGQPGRTAERFVAIDGVLHYDTGDRVIQHDGVLHFLGRDDHQVKVRGHRVELGELEAALRAVLGVAAVAVALPAARPDHLVALVEADTIDPGALAAELAQRLPAYMRPRRIVPVPAFPKTPNGKVDRVALAQQAAAGGRG